MTENEFRAHLETGRLLLLACANFPAHEVRDYADKHHGENKEARAIVRHCWAVHLECGADLYGKEYSKPVEFNHG